MTPIQRIQIFGHLLRILPICIRNKSVFSILCSKLRRYAALAVKNIEVNFMFLARLFNSLQ